MNNLLITKENKKTKRFILVFLLFTIYFFNGSLILAQNERISVNVKNESVEVVLKKITKNSILKLTEKNNNKERGQFFL